ncbi:MAG: T9SS type A sorting domain-containing protein [Saprospiraceae bacterium]|nr:T9SS type A sorting domain-containing protein [Saprospiraceae bacterium]
MKKFYTLLLISLFLSTHAAAQERYLDEVFDSVTVSTDNTYAVNLTVLSFPEIRPDTLTYDMYLPYDDDCESRPLAVVLHTGTFLPRGLFAPTGAKDDYASVQVCTRLAKMGYAAASVRYRLGWNPIAPSEIERRATVIQAAYRSVQDQHTFIRFMNMLARDAGNPYGIDTNTVAVFGVGTGGFVGFNAAAINDVSEIFIPKFENPYTGEPYIDTLVLGDITGQKPGQINIPNHVGYSSDFHFAFGLDGAVGDSTWLEIGTTVPLVAVGTVTHPTTPFGWNTETMSIDCDMPVETGAGTGVTVVDIAGSACLMDKANSLGINDVLNAATFDDPVSEALRGNNLAQEHLWAINLPGPQAGPWEYWDSTFWKMVPCSPALGCDNIHQAGLVTNPDMSMEKANAYLDTALAFFAPRAYVAMNLGEKNDCTVSSTVLHKVDVDFKVHPNPASNLITLSSGAENPIQRIALYDPLGRLITADRSINNHVYLLGVGHVQPGIYFLRVDFEEGFVTETVMIER